MERDVLMRFANRYEVLLKALEGVITTREASGLLGKSYRQTLRLKVRVEQEGLPGLFYHRSHPDPKRVSDPVCQRVLDLKRQYPDYNLSHFRDTLASEHGISLSLEFYRKLLFEKGLHQVRRFKRGKIPHRKRFEASQAGLLVQRDTSIHFWRPGSEKPWKLILDLDDCSRTITGALFSLQDDVLSNLEVTRQTLMAYGLPAAYYLDNNPIFHKISRLPQTYQYFRYQRPEEASVPQFKRALDELGVRMINATPYQPQGKGKIERLFRFLQDRLLKEMAFRKVRTLEEANRDLRRFVGWYNSRWKHGTTGEIPSLRLAKNNGFKPLPQGFDLAQVLCLKYPRQVKADNTIQLDGQTYQIPPNAHRISYAKAKVEARVYLNGRMQIFHQNNPIASYKQLKTINPDKGLCDVLVLQGCDNLALR